MKKLKSLLFIGLCVGFSSSVFALSDPVVDTIPATVDADFYTIVIRVTPGATVTVLGGPSFVPPVTDSEMDGQVEVLVGLAQEQLNVFSISAEINRDFSDSVEVSINETSDTGKPKIPGDHTAPDPPELDEINNPVSSLNYTITGLTEAFAEVHASRSDGSSEGTVVADEDGYFSITVSLETGKTNRINLNAEDIAGNIGSSSQAMIQAVEPALPEAEVYEEPEEEEIVEEMQQEVEPEGPVFSFTDTAGHWAEDYIRTLFEAGVISGKSETIFDPNAQITRAELTKIAINGFGYTASEVVTENPFSDVEAGVWYASYIDKAKAIDIVKGYDDGFHPNEPITRAAALKIMLEAANVELGNYQTNFSDVPQDQWFTVYVGFAQVNEIVGGYEDGSFKPGNPITRAEVTKIVRKILDFKG